MLNFYSLSTFSINLAYIITGPSNIGLPIQLTLILPTLILLSLTLLSQKTMD